MAPSRALLCRATSASARPQLPPCIRPAPRLLSTAVTRTRCSARPLISTTRQSYTAIYRTRPYSQQASTSPNPPDHLNEAELHIFNKIKGELDPVKLEVQDISGGCGSMYAIEVESAKFQGLTVIKQHKLVNQVLKEEIAQWHGVQLRTKAA